MPSLKDLILYDYQKSTSSIEKELTTITDRVEELVAFKDRLRAAKEQRPYIAFLEDTGISTGLYGRYKSHLNNVISMYAPKNFSRDYSIRAPFERRCMTFGAASGLVIGASIGLSPIVVAAAGSIFGIVTSILRPPAERRIYDQHERSREQDRHYLWTQRYHVHERSSLSRVLEESAIIISRSDFDIQADRQRIINACLDHGLDIKFLKERQKVSDRLHGLADYFSQVEPDIALLRFDTYQRLPLRAKDSIALID